MIIDIKKYLVSRSPRRLFFEISTYLFIATLPSLVLINTITLWLLVISSLLLLPLKERLINLRHNRKVLRNLLLLYLLYWIGLLVTDQVSVGIRDAVRTLGLVIIPFILLSHSKDDFNLKRVYISLGIGLFIVMLHCWAVIIISILTNATPFEQAKYFFEWIYTDWNLVKPVYGHPSYIAVLIVLFVSALIKNEAFSDFRKNKLKFLLVLSPFLLFLIETSSRIAIIGLVLIVLIYALKKINLKSILSFIGALLVVGFLSLQFDYLGSKFDDIFDNRGEVKFERYHRWNGILRAFNAEENWLIGTGSGDTQSIYDAAFIQGKFYEALKDKYNAHNQFLEFLIANGIFGLLLYIFVLLFFAYKTKLKGTAMSFFIIITLFSLSESIFGRSQGVFIFAFFYAFLIVYYNTTPKRYVEK